MKKSKKISKFKVKEPKSLLEEVKSSSSKSSFISEGKMMLSLNYR